MKQDNYKIIVDYMIENRDKFYRLAYTYVRNQEDALDIVQNSICKALEHYQAIRNIDAIKTWFYRILVNESINVRKKNGKEIVMDDMEGEVPVYYEPGYEATEDGLFEEINGLPPDVQHIIKLRFCEEMTLNEIAEIMQMNINTVKAKLYRGLKALKQEMKEADKWKS